ncbi:MAG: 5'-nucleotidase C-terminal domain-containing protein [Bacteroidota bacterium]|nr:5'-nucleotidase C-terminal domain-containing protein [Bacteroidota bacterium]MEC8033055.1 5'-nucleotidase C-terminal domain-containing protein [Bacteroidota bacterium]
MIHRQKLFVLLGITFLLNACQKPLQVIGFEESIIEVQVDSTMGNTLGFLDSLLLPYQEFLLDSMAQPIAQVAEDLLKADANGKLGILMSKAMINRAENILNQKVDCAFMNRGGIRVPVLKAGPLALGRVYELMPFDNYLVVLEIPGDSLQKVLDVIALKGGWPAYGISYKIDDDGATDVKIDSIPIDGQKIYQVALSDYIANGGDKMTILKQFEQKNTGLGLRDAFIEYFIMINQAGQAIMPDPHIVLR